MKGFSKAKGLPWPREAVSTEIHSRSRGSLGGREGASRNFRFCGSWSLDFREWGMGREHIERRVEKGLSCIQEGQERLGGRASF